MEEVISRKEAKEKGLKRYFTGKICKRGHLSERYVSTKQCILCLNNYTKSWREDNKEEWNNYQKKWRGENNFYEVYQKPWVEDNREHYYNVVNINRRKRYNDGGDYKVACLIRSSLQRVIKELKLEKQTSTYETLGYGVKEFKESLRYKFLEGMTWGNHGSLWHVDHAIPVSEFIKQGVVNPEIINSLNNLIPMWSEHNYQKGSLTLEEFLILRPDLHNLYGKFLGSEENLNET